MKACEVEGCKRKVTGRGYCNMHYQRWYKTGEPGEVSPRYRARYGDCKCNINGCEKKPAARGLCHKHYKRWQIHGNPLIVQAGGENHWTKEEIRILELYYPEYGVAMHVLLPERNKNSVNCKAKRIGINVKRIGKRKPWEPANMHYQTGSGSLYVWWPEHILANKKGRVIINKLIEWQNVDMPTDIENWVYSGKGGENRFRKRYEPRAYNPRVYNKNLELADYLYWPEHIIAAGGKVPIQKLIAWQKAGMPLDLENWIYVSGSRGTKGYYRKKFEPKKDELEIRPQGYINVVYPEHPLANRRTGRVALHRWVVWQESGYSREILKLLLDGAHIHHLNGKTDDNRPENLELRIKGNHPHGVGEIDMVKTLTSLGYKIQSPLWKN